ncbi:MAG: hypothetical protein IKK34_10505 [Clostridia bacterium]|nr:hypothetical protein [Clostridia bacterium]
MIDEYFERLVDRLCHSVPMVLKPRMILLGDSSLGWRMKLYFGTAWSKLAGAFGHIKNEETMERFMRESEERGDDEIKRLKAFFRERVLVLAKLDAWGREIRFTGMLILLMLSVLAIAGKGGTGLGVTAASVCMMWLSTAVESNYAPVARGIRQRYLAATLLRSFAIGVMMLGYFFYYVVQGVPSNVVLQSAMIITLAIHDILFLALVAFNRRQPVFLRALAGVTGMLPALTAASACALAASCIFRPWPLPFSGAAGALGAVLAFMGDQLITMTQLGGIRLKYHSIWECLLMIGGYTLMLLGAWTYTL